MKPSTLIIIFLYAGEIMLNVISPAAAEEAEASPPMATLTESDAVNYALQNAHELAALNKSVSAQERIAGSVSYTLKNPELRLQDISTEYFRSDLNQKLQVGLRWRLPKLGEFSEKKQREQVVLWEKKVKAQRFKDKLIAEVKTKYAELAMLQEYMVLTQDREVLEHDRLVAIEKLVSIGERPILDQIKARKRYIKVKKEAAVILQRYRNTQNRLSSLMGISKNFTAHSSMPPALNVNFSELHELVVSNRPEIQLSRQKAELAESRYSTDQYKMIPWFSYAETAYHYESEQRDWGELLIGIELPLFNWISGRQKANEIRIEQRTESNVATVESIDEELKDSIAEYERALAEWQSLKTEADQAIQQFEQLSQEAKKQELPEDEVIELKLSHLELKEMLLDAGFDLTKATINLCLSTGVEDWNQLNQ